MGEEEQTESRSITVFYEFSLFDDASVKKKLTVMGKYEAALDDARNPDSDSSEKIEEFLVLGRRYRITATMTEIGEAVDTSNSPKGDHE